MKLALIKMIFGIKNIIIGKVIVEMIIYRSKVQVMNFFFSKLKISTRILWNHSWMDDHSRYPSNYMDRKGIRPEYAVGLVYPFARI